MGPGGDASIPLAALLFVPLLCACGDAPFEEPVAPEPRPLVAQDAWKIAAADDDPFDDRPSSFECPADAYGPRDFGGELAFDVETGICEYITVRQPALTRVEAGDWLQLRIWHFDLVAAEGVAHVALATDTQTLWADEIEIPAEAGLLPPRVQARDAVEVGEMVYYHLHNHGLNSWSLIEVVAE